MIVEMNEVECMDFLIVQKFLGTFLKDPDKTNKADLLDQILAHREMAHLEALSEYES